MPSVGRPRSCDCGECKTCRSRETQRKWWNSLPLERRREIIARRDPEKVAEAERRRNKKPERVAFIARNTARWREVNQDKYKAHVAVGNAVRDGKLQRHPCELCGSELHVHAHHDDYSKPLDVRWLCVKHHREHHARENREDKAA